MRVRMLAGLQHRAEERGAAFLLAMVILTVLLILGASLIEQSQHAVYRATVEGSSTRSFRLAEAGAEKALWVLGQENGWNSYDGETGTVVAGGHVDVRVSPLVAGRAAEGLVRITATGYLPGPGGSQRLPRRVEVVAFRSRPWPFGYGIAGETWVDVGNSKIDSYRSELGPYGGSNVASNAAVAVNSTEFVADNGYVVSGVAVGPNGVVKGDILVGPGGEDPADAVQVAGKITGSITALDAPMRFEAMAIPVGAIDLGAVVLDGSKTLTLGSGVYRARSLSITGVTAALIVTGKVDLYVDGDIYIGGNGILNEHPGKPRNLLIYGTENCTSVQVKGSSTFYGAIYAPNAGVVAQGSTQSGEIFGSLVGKHVKLEGSNTRFHYDETLSLQGKSGIDVRSWEEL